MLEQLNITEKEAESLLHDDHVWEKLCYPADQVIEADATLKQDYAEFMAQHYPNEAPTWSMLTTDNTGLVAPSTWLMHWTDDPISIARKGFTSGEFDVSLLGLTTYRKKSGPGYNFAFRADSRYAKNYERKYGAEFVVFQSSGVECWHAGDEEDQVIFWGPSITTRPVPVVEQRDGNPKFAVYSLKADRALFQHDDPLRCIAWTIQNYRQYSKLL